MPNLKIYADIAVQQEFGRALREALPDLASLLMDKLEVPRSSCQIALIWVEAPQDQPALNVELSIMPGPKRTQKLLAETGAALQDAIMAQKLARPAVRISQLDSATFVSLKGSGPLQG